MSNNTPLISVCIPAFNRPEFMGDLLDTIVSQDFSDFEIIVCEDNSPKTLKVEQVVNRYIEMYKHIKIRFIRNKKTLGYDGNFRKLIDVSNGEYCVYMGDDDLMCEGALSRIASVIDNFHPGVIIRSWARADRDSKEILEIFRYFDGDRLFKAGNDGVVTMYRRSVAIAGYTVNRDLAKKQSTDRFDGTLLYQLYLTGMIISNSNGYYISDLIAIMRKDSSQSPTHFFGTAEAEKGRFKPGELKSSQSLNFIDGMIEIAKYLEHELNMPDLYREILRDMSSYSYPLLSVQSKQSSKLFFQYYLSLSKKGFWKSLYFHIYYISLAIFGLNRCTKVIVFIKKRLRRTPVLGSISQGDRVR
jgi:abequosyltransferase